MSFKKILIANRGEIALRIIRACREMGIATVCVYSEADARACTSAWPTRRICIGPAQAAESYLNIPNIISAAEVTDADAIHPGYGFLAENAQFAEVCEECNIVFIGPDAEAISQMGDKATRQDDDAQGRRAGHPRPQGGAVQDEQGGHDRGQRHGLPGDDQGHRRRRRQGHARRPQTSAELKNCLSRRRKPRPRPPSATPTSTSRSSSAEPRHVEIQIIGDKHGNGVHLGERECSIQRRHQKLIEEAPSPLPDAGAAGSRWARRRSRRPRPSATRTPAPSSSCSTTSGKFYFMEMNTRVQVEHPVTEMVTGVDIVKEQHPDRRRRAARP